MAARQYGNASEVRESIEAKGAAGDQDVDMADAIADEDLDAEGEDDVDVDAEGDDDMGEQGSDNADPRDLQHLLDLIETTSQYLCAYKERDEEVAAGFQRIPNKRLIPDYTDVIKEPIAFSTIRGKIQKKQYTAFSEFVRDVALISHNAQVYNRPSAPIFGQAVRLREIFVAKLQAMIQKGEIKPEEAELPDLGELPEMDESPPPDPEDEEMDEDEEDEEDFEEDDDSDDEGGRRRGRRRGRASFGKKDKLDDERDDVHKKRGRPPKVYTPMEARIHAVIKGLRKFKTDEGEPRIVPFEKLPDKQANPEYYQAILNPIALDIIKRKAKRKKYQNVDHVLADIELMFENAKLYNEEGSEIYDDAVELQNQARLLAAEQKSKPDDDFRDEDGKLPLSEAHHGGEVWRVGDWVHIRNHNDLSKPIVAQLYRIWKDASGQVWVNACWYYRPEQTVHRFEKHFYEKEVVKTGQYRDHRIEEIIDRCFVMFITRFPKGRPRGFPPDKEVYVCEARYNEEKFRFAKIKTWASCVPDEVRERDYEMDLFEGPRKLRKVPSPIKHLLREDAKETDPLPKPTWGSPNAPPMIGAVHKRPRESNESPPPEPTPPPTPAGPMEMHMDPTRRPSMKSDGGMVSTPAGYHQPGPAPMPSPSHPTYGQHFAPPRPGPTPTPPAAVPHMQHPAPHTMQSPGHMPQPPHYQQHQPPQGYGQQFAPAPPNMGHHTPMPNAMMPTYDHHRMAPTPAAMTPTRAPMAATPSTTAIPHANANANAYNPPRPVETYTLPEGMDAAIQPDVRERFQRDEQGRILFFTAPPLNRAHNGVASESADLGHSVRYSKDIATYREERRRKRQERDEVVAVETRKKAALVSKEREETEAMLWQAAGGALGELVQHIDAGTKVLNESLGGWDRAALVAKEQHSPATNGTSNAAVNGSHK